MHSQRILFNGSNLTEEFIASDVLRPIPNVEYETVSVPTEDGVKIRNRTLRDLLISMDLWCVDSSRLARREAVRRLSAMLGSAKAGPLAFSDDCGLYYMAHMASTAVTEYIDAVCVGVEFKVPDPAMYGATRSVAVPSGGSVSFNVGGTYPTRPKIEAAAAVRNASSLVWGVRLDEGDYIHIQTGSASARAVSVDCQERACRVSGAVALPTIDSDWLKLEPGEHAIRIDNGSGSCIVTWDERWL